MPVPPPNQPGVFIDEREQADLTIPDLPTGVPAFLGYTERGDDVLEIGSAQDFEQAYGGAEPTPFQVQVSVDHAGVATVTGTVPAGDSSQPRFLLAYAIEHYFANGGGACYVVPLGRFGVPQDADFAAGLDRLREQSGPTLVVLVDAVSLPASEHAALAAQAMALCADLEDRFALLDVPNGDVVAFRSGIGTDHLSYGAAYHPYLETTYGHVTVEDQVVVQGLPSPTPDAAAPVTLADLEEHTSARDAVAEALAGHRVVLPPSAAVAGIWARTDRELGVWKAPANALVADVVGPTISISEAQQAALDDDPEGRSINTIRDFPGRGLLVWGARTLAGSADEWRYVPVRRLLLSLERSIDGATAFAVFEPNDSATWLRLRVAVDDYLRRLWQQGALVGSTPRDAYFVRIGLGETMTDQDVLDGRLVIEVGVAAVRPAEFVILQITHLLQPS